MYMIMLVLDDPDQLDPLIEAWEKAGVRGATIVESTGIGRRKRSPLGMRYVFPGLGRQEEGHFTLFVIVRGETEVQACLHATEALIGDLDKPDTGVFAAWELHTVKGLPSAPQTGGADGVG